MHREQGLVLSNYRISLQLSTTLTEIQIIKNHGLENTPFSFISQLRYLNEMILTIFDCFDWQNFKHNVNSRVSTRVNLFDALNQRIPKLI